MAKHEKVSVDEIRARREQAVLEQANQVNQVNQSRLGAEDQQLGAQSQQMDMGTNVDAQIQQQSSDPRGEPASTAPIITPLPIVVPVVPVVPDLESMLAAMTPDQLAKLRVIAAAKGVAVAVPTTGSVSGTKHPDGSMTVSVVLSPEIIEQLALWAEPDGLSVAEEAQRRINEALTNYLYGDWSPNPEPMPAPVVDTATVTK